MFSFLTACSTLLVIIFAIPILYFQFGKVSFHNYNDNNDKTLCYILLSSIITHLHFLMNMLADEIVSKQINWRVSYKFVIALGGFFPSLILFTSPMLRNNILISVAISNSQLVWVLFGINRAILSCNHTNKKIHTILVTGSIFWSFGFVLSTFAYVAVRIRLILGVFACALFVIASLSMLRLSNECIKIHWNANNKPMHERFVSVISSFCLLVLVIISGVYALVYTVCDTDNSFIESQTMSTLIVLFVILTMHGRMNNYSSKQLQIAYSAKNAFVRNTAHEIRTPMNSVILGLQLLKKEMMETGIFTKDMLDIMGDVVESSEVAVSLVSDLLTHDKLQQGQLTIEKQNIKVWNLLHRVVKPFFSQAKQARVTLEIKNSSIPHEILRSVSVIGDQVKLSQVFRNLLSNALKFTPSSGRVSVRAVSLVSMPLASSSFASKLFNFPSGSYILHHSPDTKATGAAAGGGGGVAVAVGMGMMSPRHTPGTALRRMLSFKSDAAHAIHPYVCTHWLKIEVVDTGAGISKENQGRLFKEVIQFHAAKLQGGKGSGIGMMITKGIVDLHGGRISVSSEGEGLGCVFTLELPVFIADDESADFDTESKEDDHDHEHENTPLSRAGSDGINRFSGIVTSQNSSQKSIHVNSIVSPLEGYLNRSIRVFPEDPRAKDSMGSALSTRDEVVNGVTSLRILVVDDSRINRRMLVRLLPSYATVEEAEDGLVALNKVTLAEELHSPFHLVLMDYHMPNMDGPTTAMELRTRKFKGVIIGITGAASDEDRTRYLNHGVNAILAKPVDTKVLDRIIEELLNNEYSLSINWSC